MDSNHLIEELMLLANKLVGLHLLEKLGASAVLRRHPAPKKSKAKKSMLIADSAR